jgi:KDO2-lipid IV(A) lauroyltransferase
LINEIRKEAGAKILSPKAPSRTMLRHLKEGRFLGLIADQDARSRGVWVDFFGQPSSRPRGGAVFGLQLGLPIFFVSSLMGPDRRDYIRFRPIDMDNLPDEKEPASRELTQRFMVMLEAEVRGHPEQYFWFHRMWKTKPPA